MELFHVLVVPVDFKTADVSLLIACVMLCNCVV
jgi:hypothetical protein